MLTQADRTLETCAMAFRTLLRHLKGNRRRPRPPVGPAARGKKEAPTPRRTRSGLFTLALAVLTAAFGSAFAWWGLTTAGRDLTGAARLYAFECRRGQHLDAQDREIVRCVEGKVRVMEDLAAGRLSLEEAAEHFRRLEDERDASLGRPPVPAGPEREDELRRLVLRFLQAHRRREAARRAALTTHPEAIEKPGTPPG